MVEEELGRVQQCPENVFVGLRVLYVGVDQGEKILGFLFGGAATECSDEEFFEHGFGGRLRVDEGFDFSAGGEAGVDGVADREMQGLRDRRGGFRFAGADGASAGTTEGFEEVFAVVQARAAAAARVVVDGASPFGEAAEILSA